MTARLRLSKNLFPRKELSKQQGELEGAKPASNEIECLQKACASRRLRRAAAAFRTAARAEKRGIVKADKKVQRTFCQPETCAPASRGARFSSVFDVYRRA